jgi:hypothetical protein
MGFDVLTAATAALAAGVATFSIAKAFTDFSRRPRRRKKLLEELDIWAKLPDGPSKEAMGHKVEVDADWLVNLEDPQRRNAQRRLVVSFMIASSAVLVVVFAVTTRGLALAWVILGAAALDVSSVGYLRVMRDTWA